MMNAWHACSSGRGVMPLTLIVVAFAVLTWGQGTGPVKAALGLAEVQPTRDAVGAAQPPAVALASGLPRTRPRSFFSARASR
jgi:hypothetical protein